MAGTCPDLVVRQEVSQVCGARPSCSLLADQLTLDFISGGQARGRERGRSCHTTGSSSVLRTTHACIDQSALLYDWTPTTTEQPSSQPTLSRQQGDTTVAVVEVEEEEKAEEEEEENEEVEEDNEEVFSGDKESVIAKPLEPQPGVGSPSVAGGDGGDSESLTNILIILTSSLTAGLSVLLLTILYKLYQTYQSPPSSPLNTPLNNQSQYSITTQLTQLAQLDLTELSELTGVESPAVRLTETGGTWPGKTERKYSVRFDDEPQYLSVSPPAPLSHRSAVLSSDKITGEDFLRQEAAERWQFPRVAGTGTGRKTRNKYLSL